MSKIPQEQVPNSSEYFRGLNPGLQFLIIAALSGSAVGSAMLHRSQAEGSVNGSTNITTLDNLDQVCESPENSSTIAVGWPINVIADPDSGGVRYFSQLYACVSETGEAWQQDIRDRGGIFLPQGNRAVMLAELLTLAFSKNNVPAEEIRQMFEVTDDGEVIFNRAYVVRNGLTYANGVQGVLLDPNRVSAIDGDSGWILVGDSVADITERFEAWKESLNSQAWADQECPDFLVDHNCVYRSVLAPLTLHSRAGQNVTFHFFDSNQQSARGETVPFNAQAFYDTFSRGFDVFPFFIGSRGELFYRDAEDNTRQITDGERSIRMVVHVEYPLTEKEKLVEQVSNPFLAWLLAMLIFMIGHSIAFMKWVHEKGAIPRLSETELQRLYADLAEVPIDFQFSDNQKLLEVIASIPELAAQLRSLQTNDWQTLSTKLAASHESQAEILDDMLQFIAEFAPNTIDSTRNVIRHIASENKQLLLRSPDKLQQLLTEYQNLRDIFVLNPGRKVELALPEYQTQQVSMIIDGVEAEMSVQELFVQNKLRGSKTILSEVVLALAEISEGKEMTQPHLISIQADTGFGFTAILKRSTKDKSSAELKVVYDGNRSIFVVSVSG